MNDNPFDRYAPLAEVEEPTWEFEHGIIGSSVDSSREAIERKVHPIMAAMGIIFILLFVRLLTIQVIHGSAYRLAAQGNSIRTSEIMAPRGLIQDQFGTVLVRNVANYSLEIIPAYLPVQKEERQATFNRIQEYAGVVVDAEQIKAAGLSLNPITLEADISSERAHILTIQLANTPGVIVAKRPRREYIDLPGIAHLLGYIGRISREELEAARVRGDERYGYTSIVGKTGLELNYEERLKGRDGKTQLEVDARGRKIRQLASIQPEPGNNLHLHLNSTVQRTLSESLAASIKRVGSKAGAAIAIDPMTGGILGLASFPSYDPAVFSSSGHTEAVGKLLSDPRHPLVNRPIAGLYPPGSTIKPLWAAVGLQEKTISTKTTIQSVGGFTIGQFTFKDWKAGGHGLTDIKKAIAESVNTFFYAVAGGHANVFGLGIERLKAHATIFGIGSATGIDLPGEKKGFFPDPDWKRRTRGENWFIGNTYQVGIGQGDVLVTPVEMLMALTSLINGGEILKPQIVSQITAYDGSVIQEYGKAIIRLNGISTENLEIVKEGMRMTVTDGSARSLSDLSVEAGGKTGTAQYASRKKTHAWFFGFTPWKDPKIAVLVLVEEGGEGTIAAAPVAKDVFKAYFPP